MRVELTGGLSLSRVALGCMRLHDWQLSDKKLLHFIEWCVDSGVSTFDHADIYGGDHHNEKLFGAALKLSPAIKEKITLTTKCAIVVSEEGPDKKSRYYDTDRKYIVKQVDNSLAALGVEKIDLLFVHMYDLLADPYVLTATLIDLVKQGKVGQLGLSNHSTQEVELMQSIAIQKFVAHQFKLNPLDITNLSNGVMTQCFSQNIHPMVWSPVAGSEFFPPRTDNAKKIKVLLESIASEQEHYHIDRIIYQWLLMHPAKPTVVLGSGNPDRIRNALFAEHDNIMSRSQWYRIAESAGYPFW